ncbi:hypothetical protein, partial [Dubosiella newyorkensis]|uniref:hypothetical protein n=1 Tax=Dubosiella newyorkensis TaxID=1862672 RepID=UPI00272C822E
FEKNENVFQSFSQKKKVSHTFFNHFDVRFSKYDKPSQRLIPSFAALLFSPSSKLEIDGSS